MHFRRICKRSYCSLHTVLLVTIFMVTLAVMQKAVFKSHTRFSEQQSHVFIRKQSSFLAKDGNTSVTEDEVVKAWDVINVHCSANVSLTRMPWFADLGKNIQQFLLYRHCRFFPMIFNHPEKCEGDVFLLLVVKSMIPQHRRREAIRKTWGQEREVRGKRIKLVFLLGAATRGEEHPHHQKLLEYEDRLYGDILQWDFEESFYNLTLKEVNFLKWFSIYCPSVPFIFKGDDDIFVHTGNVVEFLESSGNEPDLLIGAVLYTSPPVREKNSKYFIPLEIFNETFYPPYVSGGGFLMAGPLAMKMHIASEDLDLFPIDDAFLGMCLKVLSVSPKEHTGIKTWGVQEPGRETMSKDPCFYQDLLVVHRFEPGELILMWKLLTSDLICTQVRLKAE
nr:PREDICTED: UDP-GlcNAc:betaGal beta-1,3-N-acetylglucosaminyltransferase 7-like isoform X2 [Lepisosteus oculatus]XP_015211462.1 PREDICTED: UDP-GlcNAc:betaGal beta-1,3-N-acetylglucosaminyltransferase 7-like isoform X2 [Lepisosteus oculatus]